jgi:hypothetical protein
MVYFLCHLGALECKSAKNTCGSSAYYDVDYTFPVLFIVRGEFYHNLFILVKSFTSIVYLKVNESYVSLVLFILV